MGGTYKEYAFILSIIIKFGLWKTASFMRTEPYDDRLTKGAFVARKKKRQMLLLLFAYKK